MKTFVPSYYKKFYCIAGDCRHSCCIGWEIDVDEETLAYYDAVGGELGERMRRCIERGETPHFCLGEQERCPFLNEKNLCDIIAELSEASLCQVCRDHPRFRNYFDEHIEMGLGITCEEAARIVLSSELPDAVTLVSLDGNDSNVPMFPERFTVFDVLLDSEMTLPEKLRVALHICDGEFKNKSLSEWLDIYSELELLDEAWKTELELLKDEISGNTDIPLIDYAKSILLHCDLSVLLTRLLAYFLYRHLADGIEGALGARAAFCVLSLLMIASIFKAHLEAHGELTDEQIVDIARMYSSEIEYSDENLDKLIDIFK